MSRIGKEPVSIPANVEVILSSSDVLIKGPLGQLQRDLNSNVIHRIPSIPDADVVLRKNYR